MKPQTVEWIDKAEGDFAMVACALNAAGALTRDGICFHCQQCVEKYLKARLVEGGIPVPKTHDLVQLLDLILAQEPGWNTFRATLAGLTVYGVTYRYPGLSATAAQTQQAVADCTAIRAAVRQSLGLPP